MSAALERVGTVGLLALVLLVAAAAFHWSVQRPLEDELRVLEQSIRASRPATPSATSLRPVSQMSAFYRFFEHPMATHEWLAKLHAIARAAGVELPSADYQAFATGTRIVRYQLRLPLKTTYAQARAFMANALNEIPVLSVEQASFRRTAADDARLEVEVVVTLHLLEL